MEKVSYLGQTLTRWQVGNSTFLALPEKGARLMNWHLALGDSSVRDILYWAEDADFGAFHKVRGGNPILFPFSARTFDAGELGFWRDPAGERRPMPMHGFARQGEFKVTRLDARGFTALLVPDEEAKQAYPFKYEFTVAYRFSELGLACELSLRNLDTQPIPWSAGHHFYFTAPWAEGQSRGDYIIRIPSTRTLRQDPVGKLIPGPVLKAEERLDNPALVDAIHLGLKSNAVSFGPAAGSGHVTVRNGTSAVPSPEATFVTWTMTPESPFYCVEPWMGPPNASETKVGLHWVQPGQVQNFVVEIAVK
ncbi:MAG: aldose epimerase [Opitutaceae bacterium]|jgi:galactose mutarotase-like enzyme